MNIIHKGASIYYTDQGKGPSVIFLHGFLGNKSMWDPLMSTLKNKYRIICIDLLGHGKSECTGYIHTMEDMAAAVYSVICALSITNLQIVGHSMGGYVGLAFAKAYPEITKALCLLNSTPRPDELSRKKLRARANEMAKKNYEQLVRMSFVNLFNPNYMELHKEKISSEIKQALNTSRQGYIAANTGMAMRLDHTEFWKNTTLKKGLILGETDCIIPIEKEVSDFLIYSDFFKKINGSHMLHLSHPEQTMAAIQEFLGNAIKF